MLLRLLPFLLMLAYGLAMYQFSVWRMRRQLDQQSSELADPGLKAVIDRMAQALDLPRIRVHIYEVQPINGLAAPDGRIFLTRGFYEAYRKGLVSAEELASVIAHELGHVALGHTRRRMIDFSGQNAIRAVLGTVLGRFIPGIGPMLAGLVATMLAARLSRGDEFGADAYAAALLTKSGIGTQPQKDLFRKLNSLTGNPGASTPAWLLSHPDAECRIEAIEALERKWMTA